MPTFIRATCIMLALFFVVLAVFDGFEQEQEIEYVGEFLSETDFDYVDFPTSISRPSNNQTLKIQRLILLNVVDFLSEVFNINTSFEKVVVYIPVEIFFGLDYLIGKSIAANAP
ncbi:hypothetical protein IPZ59_12950 [Mongoliitalea daihaiensis]|nr:hypothetical protein IPZ59_12950 [Mongoliitalea daihaiensis]